MKNNFKTSLNLNRIIIHKTTGTGHTAGTLCCMGASDFD
jgi:hypothetical protein